MGESGQCARENDKSRRLTGQRPSTVSVILGRSRWRRRAVLGISIAHRGHWTPSDKCDVFSRSLSFAPSTLVTDY